ncbi:MAG: adenosylcobinamide-GDP ribazoletransferase [Synergistales bacterium]|nr:adenosylcobinamide-GDP ribazoletransferase [Synergistales bacterium]
MEFFRALSLLTLIPAPKEDNTVPSEPGRMIAWFPLVGAVIGGLLLFFHGIMAFLFQPMLSRGLLLVFWIILTRGFTLNSFGWTFSISGNRSIPEKGLHMEGTMVDGTGILAMICIFLVKFAALSELQWQFFSKALILAPILGRWGMVLAIRFFPPASHDETGDIPVTMCSNREFFIASATAAILAVLLSGFYGFFFLAVCGGMILLISWGVTKTFGGLSVESRGALCETGEVISLLAANFIMKLFLSGY